MNISWNGDSQNEPKTGKIVKIEGELVHIEWSDGSKMVAPDFTLNARYGWKRW